MEIKSLNDLPQKEDGTYDLTIASFQEYGSPYTFFKKYVVTEQFEMRIDLICNDIYDSVEYVDFLLWFNRIVNPFNIRSGMELNYVPEDIIPNFYAPKENQEEVQQVFLNNSKKKRKDKKRDRFLENKRAALPPTVNEVKVDQVKIDGNRVIIGGDLFNV